MATAFSRHTVNSLAAPVFTTIRQIMALPEPVHWHSHQRNRNNRILVALLPVSGNSWTMVFASLGIL